MRNYTLVYVWKPEVRIGEIGYFEQLRKYQVRCRVYVFMRCLLTGRRVQCVVCVFVSMAMCQCVRVHLCKSVQCVMCVFVSMGCVSVFTYEFTSQSHEVYLAQFFLQVMRGT